MGRDIRRARKEAKDPYLKMLFMNMGHGEAGDWAAKGPITRQSLSSAMSLGTGRGSHHEGLRKCEMPQDSGTAAPADPQYRLPV